MGFNWGAFAGGAALGYERGSQMALARGAEERAKRREGREEEEFYEKKTKRERESRVYDDLANLIDRYNGTDQSRAATQSVEARQPSVVELPTNEQPGFRPAPAVQPGPGLERPISSPGDVQTPSVGGPMLQATPPFAPSGGGLPRIASSAPAGQKEAHERVGFGLYQNPDLFRNPQFLNEAAQVFLRAKMPEGIKFLEQGYKAQQENAISALQRALSGDFRGAERLFNQSGQFKVMEGTLQPTEDGKQLTMQLADGKTHTFDPRQAMRSYLSPKDFLAVEHQEATLAATKANQERQDKTNEQYRKDWAEIGKQNASTMEQYRKDMAEVQRRLATVKETNKEPTEKDWQKVSVNMRAMMTKLIDQSAPVDDVTKKKLPNPLAEFVPEIVADAMTATRAGTQPELALEEAYIGARTRLDNMDRVLSPIFDKAKKAGQGWFAGEKDSLDALRRDINDLISQGADLSEIRRYAKATGKDTALLNKAYGGTSSAPPARGRQGLTPRADAAAPEPKVHQPKTPAEMQAVPRGERYKNPSDGVIYLKN